MKNLTGTLLNDVEEDDGNLDDAARKALKVARMK